MRCCALWGAVRIALDPFNVKETSMAQTTFNAAYLAARKSVRITHTKRGEWHAYHRGLKIMVAAGARERAVRKCAMLAAKQLMQ
jgi:hypothetical protein